ncbi:MAG: hypothetical protein AAGA75_15690 [Cyanobacteria bacterium P01_E01_bin.6]
MDKLSKAERRKQKREEKALKKKKAVKFPPGFEEPPTEAKRIAPIPDLHLKIVKFHEKPTQDKSVYIPTVEVFSLDCHLTWCTTISDLDGEWSWREKRVWTDEEWSEQILPKFNLLEGSTWNEILNVHKTNAKGGKSVPSHHDQELMTLDREAQNRWIEIGLEEFDTAFRFRFSNTVRAWGIRLQGHFYLVWWERFHKIYRVGH